MNTHKIRLTLAGLILLTLSLAGCMRTIDYMVVGVGTPKGNEIFITNITFDDEWSAIGGTVSCCWSWAGGLHGVYNRSAPKSVYVQWYDYDPETRYEATIPLSNELYDLATDLPVYQVIHNKRIESNIHPYLILGFSETEEVVVWVSNAPHDENISGRVLHEVGRAQAKVLELNQAE